MCHVKNSLRCKYTTSGKCMIGVTITTCYGAAGACGADEMGDLAVCLFPDLRARGFVMRLSIGEIIVLIAMKGIGDLFG